MGGEGRELEAVRMAESFRSFAVKGSREMLAGLERVGFCLFACF